ncbi:MAG: hypothetical protein PHV98_00700 [Candidatus Omnitrophica bacterium]|nr:hypothetical protein [Candidatus Omnitrophota bacterium]
MEDQTGLNRELALDLRDRFSLETFLETGTYRGESCIWAAEHFRNVISIEKDVPRYQKVIGMTNKIKNIQLHLGDSRNLLFTILRDVLKPALIYLDAHLFGFTKEGWINNDQCPLKEELLAVRQIRIGHIVIIDDAKWFTDKPDFDHDPNQFIRLNEIKTILRDHEITKVEGWNCLLCLPRMIIK